MTRTQPAYSYRTDPAVPTFADDKPVIVFDGYCVLCSGFAQFVMKRDPGKRFRLVAAQSAVAQALYRHYGLNPADPESNILLEDGRIRLKADAAAGIFGRLGFPWSLVAPSRYLPRGIANWLYDRIARNRIALFGAREQCFLPRPEDADRFLA